MPKNPNIPRVTTLAASFGLLLYLLAFLSISNLPIPTEDGGQQLIPRGIFFLIQVTLPSRIFDQWMAFQSMPFGWTDRILPMLAVGVWLGLSLGIGHLGIVALDRRLPFASRSESRIENMGVRIVLGLHALSLLVFGLGICGWLSTRWPLLLCLVGGTLVFCWLGFRRRGDRIFGEIRSSDNLTAAPMSYPQRRFAGLLAIAAVLVAGISFWGSLQPPIEFDVREYHLQAPKEFQQSGRIGFVEHNIYANMPLGAEMHSLAWMVLIGGEEGWFWGGIIGKTLTSSFSCIAACLIGGIVQRRMGTLAGWVAATSYLTCPGIIEVSRLGLIDGVLACYVAGSLSILDQYFLSNSNPTPVGNQGVGNQRHWQGAILLGSMLGAAASIKYTAVPMVLGPFLAVAVVEVLRPRAIHLPLRWSQRSLIGVGLMGSLTLSCGPWYAKNLFLTGNPVYPLMSSLLGGKTMTSDKVEQWNRAHQVPRIPSNPQYADYRGQRLGIDLYDVMLSSRYLGLTIIPLGVLGLLISSRQEQLRIGWLLFGMFGVWWLCTHRLDRFWLPLLSIWALLAGTGAHWLQARWQGWLLYFFAGFGALFGLLVIASWPYNDNRLFVTIDALRRDRYAMDRQSAATDPEVGIFQRVPEHQRWINQNLTKKDRVLLVGDAQVYDLEVPIFYSTCFDRSLLETLIRDLPPHEQWERLRDRGITHVVVHWGEIERYRQPGNYGFSNYIQKRLFQDLVDQGVLTKQSWPITSDRADLYQLTSESP